MVSFNVETSRSWMISNSGGVAKFSESFEMLRLSVMQSSFRFTNVESIAIPATGFVDNLRFLFNIPCETYLLCF